MRMYHEEDSFTYESGRICRESLKIESLRNTSDNKDVERIVNTNPCHCGSEPFPQRVKAILSYRFSRTVQYS